MGKLRHLTIDEAQLRPSSGLNECPSIRARAMGTFGKIGTCCRDASGSTGAVRMPANYYLIYHVIPTRPT
jgi:hypothetical protein